MLYQQAAPHQNMLDAACWADQGGAACWVAGLPLHSEASGSEPE